MAFLPARMPRRRRSLRRQVLLETSSAALGCAAERALRHRERGGFVGADEIGFLYGSAQIFLFVLAVGAFITVTMKTGAIQTGIGRLALRFRHSGSL